MAHMARIVKEEAARGFEAAVNRWPLMTSFWLVKMLYVRKALRSD
jgi:hypothetical protein